MQAKQAATVVVVSLALPIALAAPAEAATYLQRSDSGPSKLALDSVPRAYLSWYQQAARTCRGLPWAVLAGIGEMESDHGQSTAAGVHSAANFAGAEGPMQFEPGTFAAFAVHADRSHALSPYNPQDAIYTAAHMLCANGARGGSPSGITSALYTYNHADWYPPQVLGWAAKYATRGGAHRLVTKRASVVRAGSRSSAVVHTITSRHPHHIVTEPHIVTAPHIVKTPHIATTPHTIEAPHGSAPHKAPSKPTQTPNPLAPTTGPAPSRPTSLVPTPSGTPTAASSAPTAQPAPSSSPLPTPPAARPTATEPAAQPTASQPTSTPGSGDAQQLAAEAQQLSAEARQLSNEAEQLSAEAHQLSAQPGSAQVTPAQGPPGADQVQPSSVPSASTTDTADATGTAGSTDTADASATASGPTPASGADADAALTATADPASQDSTTP